MNLHRMDRGQLGELLGVKSQWNWEYGMWSKKTSKGLNLGFSWLNLKSEIRDLYDIGIDGHNWPMYYDVYFSDYTAQI